MISPTLTVWMLLCLSSAATLAQTSSTGRSDDRSLITLTFTFKAAPVGCVGYQSNDGSNRFYIEFPSSNKPSTLVSDIESSIEIRKEKDRSTDTLMVYSVRFESGTPPRFGPGKTPKEMVLRFKPAETLSLTHGEPAPNQSKPPASAEIVAREVSTPTTTKTNTKTPAQPVTGEPSAVPSQPQLAAFGSSQAETLATAGGTPESVGQTPQPGASSLLPNEQHPFSDAVEKLNLANIDLSVPESPAFTVLGLTPQAVTRPTSPRQLATSLLNGVDQRGNFQSGIALDFSPYMTYAGDHLTLQSYRQSYGLRLLTRTQTSFATTKGASSEDKSLRLALGFHVTLLDKGDPHSDAKLMECFAEKLVLPGPPQIAPPIPPGNNASEVEKLRFEVMQKEFDEAMAKFGEAREAAAQKNVLAAEDCRQKARKRNWNRSSWIIAAAPTWISPTGQTGDYRYDGGGAWTSLAYGFEGIQGLENTSQLIFHARYRNKETVPEPEMEGKFFRQDSFFLGARLRAGTENSSASFEGVFQRQRRLGLPFENSSRLAFGIERKIAENIWFQLAFGGQNATPDGKKKGFVLSTFKWGFSQKREFVTPKQ
jgi:hypothetical protein